VNLPNLLTLSRVGAVFVLYALLALGGPGAAWAALGVYALAALTDAVDGYLARRLNAVTRMGTFLDALVDKIFVLCIAVTLLAVAGDVSPVPGLPPGSTGVLWPVFPVCIVLMLVREFAVTGLRMLAVQRGVVLAAEGLGKIKAALQMVSLGLLLLGFAALQPPTLGGPVNAGSGVNPGDGGNAGGPVNPGGPLNAGGGSTLSEPRDAPGDRFSQSDPGGNMEGGVNAADGSKSRDARSGSTSGGSTSGGAGGEVAVMICHAGNALFALAALQAMLSGGAYFWKYRHLLREAEATGGDV